MALKGNRAQRAAKVKRKINAVIRSGEFKLAGGYLWGLSGASYKCEGCAIAGACVALTNARPLPGQRVGRDSIFDKLHGHELITPSDVAQLEMGYEGWTTNGVGHWGENRQIAAIYSHPFYKIGKQLRVRLLRGFKKFVVDISGTTK